MKELRQAFPATIIVIVITSIFTLLQFAYPEVLSAFRRNPSALNSGEWWRMFTPLLVHSDGIGQYVFNMVCLAILGSAVEKASSWWLFLALYAAGGLAGEIAGYSSWDPNGAGASVGFCGLLGGLVVWFLYRKAEVKPLVSLMGLFIVLSLAGAATERMAVTVVVYVVFLPLLIVVKRIKGAERLQELVCGWGTLLGALALIGLRDIHGVSVIVGSAVALVLLPFLNPATKAQ